MKNSFYKVIHYKNYLLLMLLIVTILSLTFNPTLLALKTSQPKKNATLQIHLQAKNNPLPSATPTLQPKTTLSAVIQMNASLKPTTTPTIPETSITVQSQPTQIPTSQPTHIQIIPTSTNTPTPVQTIQTVNLQIQIPGNNITAVIPLKSNTNACDVLQEAKDENKLTSLTFDDSYMSMMHSRYVKEINGYQNNWTFTVNGAAPLGCSLSNPQPNDTIVWKFD